MGEDLIYKYRETHVIGGAVAICDALKTTATEMDGKSTSSSSASELVPVENASMLENKKGELIGQKVTPAEASKAAIKSRIQSLFRKQIVKAKPAQ